MNQSLQNSFELMYQMLDTFTIDQIKTYLENKIKDTEPSKLIENQIKTIKTEMINQKM